MKNKIQDKYNSPLKIGDMVAYIGGTKFYPSIRKGEIVKIKDGNLFITSVDTKATIVRCGNDVIKC